MQDGDSPDNFDALSDPRKTLAANLQRVLAVVPKGNARAAKPGRRPRLSRIKSIKPSTQRNVLTNNKAANLDTVAKISQELKTPAWMLLHPNMKEWDQDRYRIMFIISRYLRATANGQEAMMALARELKAASPAEIEERDKLLQARKGLAAVTRLVAEKV